MLKKIKLGGVNKRRALLVAGAALPVIAGAELFSEKLRRVAVLLGYSVEDPGAQVRFGAFKKALAEHGWEESRNLNLQVRWTEGEVRRATQFARELVAQQPDVIVSNTTPVTAAVLRETHSIPVVFTVVSDPVGSGFVPNLARPGGNVTGLINIEASLAEKWVEVLLQIAPKLKRVAVMFNPATAPYAEYYLSRLNAAAAALKVIPFMAAVTSAAGIEDTMREISRDRATGLVVMTDSFTLVHRKTVIASAARRKVPAIYPTREYTEDGGLVSYGVDHVELFRRAAAYVDRILRGTKPAELPVGQPSKFELTLNTRTAKTLGLAVPQAFLLRVDKVIE